MGDVTEATTSLVWVGFDLALRLADRKDSAVDVKKYLTEQRAISEWPPPHFAPPAHGGRRLGGMLQRSGTIFHKRTTNSC